MQLECSNGEIPYRQGYFLERRNDIKFSQRPPFQLLLPPPPPPYINSMISLKKQSNNALHVSSYAIR